MPVSELQQIVGRTLIGATGIADGFIDDLSATVARARDNWKTTSEILELVRNAIADFEPLLAEHLSDTVLSAWINGYDNVAKQFPLWLQQEFTDTIRRKPPQDPPVFNLFSMFDREPRLRLLNIENAAKRLFERRILTRDAFDEAEDSAKTQAFTIAGGLGADTIDRFRQWLYQDLQEGTSLRSFKNRVEDHLGSSPIAPSHLENVYRTNVQSSFRDGRETLRQNPLVTAAFPYQEYMPIEDGRVRHEHLMLGQLGLDGTGIYRIDDPIWDYFTPPWDYNCRCGTRLLTLEQAARAGVKEAQQWLKTGRPPLRPEFRYATIPFSPNPGWGSRGNVGVIVMSSTPNRCPSGYTAADPLVINGKHYTGGMFIPHDEMQHATAEQKHEIQSGKKKESAPTAEPQQQTAPANWVRSLTVGHKLKLPSGYKATIAYDSKANSRGWYAKITDAESGSTTFPKRFDAAKDAAQYAADILRARSLDAPPKPKLAKPDKFKPEKKPRTKRPPAKTLGEADWRYKSTEFISRGAKTKFRDNLAALRVLKTLEIEDRQATKAEQETISKFVGWGQFPQAFDYSFKGGSYNEYNKWSDERDELKELVGQEAYEAARASTINSHYTSPSVVEANWKMAEKLGFKGGRMLEPAVGGGYYVGLMPEDLAKKTSVTAIDMDPTATAVTRALYPNANVYTSPFEQHATPSNFYDIVTTNVPFSSEINVYDPRYKFRPVLHDYYFMRSVDTAKPGGLIMHLTSAGTMDKLDNRVRRYLNQHCELVSAVRFPGDTHKDNAGTEVVTDMLVLRKKNPAIPDATEETPEDAQPKRSGFTGTTVDSLGRLYHWVDGVRVPAPKWDDTIEVPDPGGGNPIPINRYFADRPEQILGQLDRTGTMYTGDMKNVSRTEDYDKLLQDAIDRLPENIVRTDIKAEDEQQPERIESDKKYNEGQIVLLHGQLYRYSGGALTSLQITENVEENVRGQVEIRDAARALIEAQRQGNGTDEAREQLNTLYDAYVEKHGYLSEKENSKAMKGDPDGTFLLSLEHYSSTAKKATKADIFTKDTIKPDARAESAGNVVEAVGIVLNQHGRIDTDRIASLTGKAVEDIEEELLENGLAYQVPSGGWQHASEYLSGNTRQKLKEAQIAAAEDPRFEPNVKALESHQPQDIHHEDIGIKLGSAWLPPDVVSEFAAHVLGARPTDFAIKYTPELGEWDARITTGYLHSRPSNVDIWGVKDDSGDYAVTFEDVLRSALSGKAVTIRSAFKEEGASSYPVLPEATEAAAEKVAELKEQFRDWVWQDEDRTTMLHRHYNDNYNNIVERVFDGTHLTFPGMKDTFEPREIQKNAVWRILTTGKGLLAHEVGTGKTATMVAAAMEARRLGLAQKPAICVLKSNIEQITAEAQELYPGAKILSTASMFDAKKRQQTLNAIATGDYDMVILTHDHLNAMKMKPETVRRFIQEEISELEDAILSAQNSDGDKKTQRSITKRLEAQKKKLEQQLREALKESSKDDIYFEDSGLDMLMVDEAHKFKSLPCYSSKGQIKGVPTRRSQRATNMLMRTRLLMEQQGGRGVVFATGTPIANTMGEMFNMQRYLQFDALKERGLHRFDVWADTYGNTTDRLEFKLDGDVKATTRFNEFVNLPELRHLASDFMDVQRVDNLFLKNPDGSIKLGEDGNPVPAIKRPKRVDKVVVAPSRPAIDDFSRSIIARAEALKGKGRNRGKGEDNMLSVCNDAKLGAIDLRLVDPTAEDHPDSKANRAVREIVRLFKEKPGKTQCVFSDLGIHTKATKKTGKQQQEDDGDSDEEAPTEVITKFSVFKDMQEKLVAAGIPPHMIVDFSADSMTDAKRKSAQEAMRRGEVAIAFGSTQKLGTGTNVQTQLAAIHHLDIPYVPAAIEQRDGRGYRSGNKNDEIEIYKYLQEGSADNVFWQIVANKAGFINQYMLGKGNRSMSDVETETLTPDEMISIATGDSRMLERIQLKDELRTMRRAQTRHAGDQQRHQAKLESADERRAELRATKQRRLDDSKHLEDNREFRLDVRSRAYTDRKEADEALYQAVEDGKRHIEETSSWKRKPVPIAEYRGMRVYVKPDSMLLLEGPSGEQYNSGASLASLEYAARNIDKLAAIAQREEREFEEDLKKIQEQLGPWKKSEELEAKQRRLEELEKSLK